MRVLLMQTWPQHFERLAPDGSYDSTVQHPFRDCRAAVPKLSDAAYGKGAATDSDAANATAAGAAAVADFGPGGVGAYDALAAAEEALVADLEANGTPLPMLRTFDALAGAGAAKVGEIYRYVSPSPAATRVRTGLGDCSHFCLPGALDAFLLPALQNQLEAMLA